MNKNFVFDVQYGIYFTCETGFLNIFLMLGTHENIKILSPSWN